MLSGFEWNAFRRGTYHGVSLMRPRFVEDDRALIWAFVLFPFVPLIGYTRPELAPYLVPLALYTSYCAGVLSHNHNHCPVFRSRFANSAYACWLSVFYGC